MRGRLDVASWRWVKIYTIVVVLLNMVTRFYEDGIWALAVLFIALGSSLITVPVGSTGSKKIQEPLTICGVARGKRLSKSTL